MKRTTKHKIGKLYSILYKSKDLRSYITVDKSVLMYLRERQIFSLIRLLPEFSQQIEQIRKGRSRDILFPECGGRGEEVLTGPFQEVLEVKRIMIPDNNSSRI